MEIKEAQNLKALVGKTDFPTQSLGQVNRVNIVCTSHFTVLQWIDLWAKWEDYFLASIKTSSTLLSVALVDRWRMMDLPAGGRQKREQLSRDCGLLKNENTGLIVGR